MPSEPTQADYDAVEDYIDSHEVIYLAGPIGGMPETVEAGRELLLRVEYAAMVQGALLSSSEYRVVINPYAAAMHPGNFSLPRERLIEQGVFIAGVIADAICLLPGWEESDGCLRELEAAQRACKDVYEWIDGVGMQPMQRGEA